jgi:hypothetical protein
MNLLNKIDETVFIEVEPPNPIDENLVKVYMDIHILTKANAYKGRGYEPDNAEYETSYPYVLLGKGTKAKAFLTPIELKQLEDRAYDMANGISAP